MEPSETQNSSSISSKKKKIKFVFSNFYYLKKKKRFINKKIVSFKEGYVCQDLLNNYGIGILTVLLSKEFLIQNYLIKNMTSLEI